VKKIFKSYFFPCLYLLVFLGFRVEEAASDSIVDVCSAGEISICNLSPEEQLQAVSPVASQTMIMHFVAQQNLSNVREQMQDRRSDDPNFRGGSPPKDNLDSASAPNSGDSDKEQSFSFATDVGDDSANASFFFNATYSNSEQNDQTKNIGFDSSGYDIMEGADYLPSETLVLGAAIDVGDDSANASFFFNATYSNSEQNDQTKNIGFDSSGYDIMVGADYLLSETLVLGAAISASEENTDFNGNLGGQDISLVTLSAFVNVYLSENLYLDGLVAYSDGELKGERDTPYDGIETIAESDTDISIISAATTLGYDWVTAEWQFSSFGRLEYTENTVDAYSEFVNDFNAGRGLIVEKQDGVGFLETAVGSSVSRIASLSNGVLVTTVDLEWVYRHDGDSSSVNAVIEAISDRSFEIEGGKIESDYFNAGLSLSATYANGLSAFLSMQALLGDSEFSRQAYTAGMRWDF
jgi:uncharacterized protein with beta-barrel porin domain